MATVLVSINPQYAELILSGRKQIELRRIRFNRNVDRMVIYATSPICRVIGECVVDRVVYDAPGNIWKDYGHISGVNIDFFNKYYSGRKIAVGLILSEPKRYDVPELLSNVIPGASPPQSFVYM